MKDWRFFWQWSVSYTRIILVRLCGFDSYSAARLGSNQTHICLEFYLGKYWEISTIFYSWFSFFVVLLSHPFYKLWKGSKQAITSYFLWARYWIDYLLSLLVIPGSVLIWNYVFFEVLGCETKQGLCGIIYYMKLTDFRQLNIRKWKNIFRIRL